MAKSNIKEMKRLIRRIGSNFKKNMNRSFFKKLSRELREDIQERVRDGYGNSREDTGYARKKFKKLSPARKKQRKKMQKEGKLSSKTKWNKSNQTATGELVDSLRDKSSKKGLSIEVTGKNREIYEGQEEMGRPWLYFTKEEIKKIDEHFEDAIERSLDDLFD